MCINDIDEGIMSFRYVGIKDGGPWWALSIEIVRLWAVNKTLLPCLWTVHAWMTLIGNSNNDHRKY